MLVLQRFGKEGCAHQMFIRPTEKELKNHNEQFTVISAPSFLADPNEDGTYSETFIVLSLKQRIILIGGTEYAGEIKKSIFSVMNYLLPRSEERRVGKESIHRLV